ncbi:50S ribosomal protein L24 [Tunicatimonas pelagia]|uniref:50S ribosomal protein L24 n=1 Tax=Tunicatimonas pelagia TaxID=931531 RepID=UPI00266612E1|nr:50S ribosomal protein L24 [Tunicatimonas pelagia]WKN42264.1 50S ribosomal protein L24 [Tunicatimonas pelagia]
MAKLRKKKLKIKSGDTVKVVSGNDKGKTGKVVSVLIADNKLLVEDVNVVTKHVKPSAQNPEGGRNQQEAPIHISNVMLIDPASGEPTKVGRKKNDGGKIQRYSKATGEFI